MSVNLFWTGTIFLVSSLDIREILPHMHIHTRTHTDIYTSQRKSKLFSGHLYVALGQAELTRIILMACDYMRLHGCIVKYIWNHFNNETPHQKVYSLLQNFLYSNQFRKSVNYSTTTIPTKTHQQNTCTKPINKHKAQWSNGSMLTHRSFEQYIEIQFFIPRADLAVHTHKLDKSVEW